MSTELPKDLSIKGNWIGFRKKNSKDSEANSVLNPPAQYSTLCSPSNEQEALANLLRERLEALKVHGDKVYFIGRLLADNGLRISEVLNISSGDIQPDGRVRIRGGKGSSDRIVYLHEGRELLLRARSGNFKPFNGYNRFFIYRIFKRAGIVVSFKGSKNDSVTHAFRLLYLQNLNDDVNLETKRKAIGHKSSKSTKHYVSKK